MRGGLKIALHLNMPRLLLWEIRIPMAQSAMMAWITRGRQNWAVSRAQACTTWAYGGMARDNIRRFSIRRSSFTQKPWWWGCGQGTIFLMRMISCTTTMRGRSYEIRISRIACLKRLRIQNSSTPRSAMCVNGFEIGGFCIRRWATALASGEKKWVLHHLARLVQKIGQQRIRMQA